MTDKPPEGVGSSCVAMSVSLLINSDIFFYF